MCRFFFFFKNKKNGGMPSAGRPLDSETGFSLGQPRTAFGDARLGDPKICRFLRTLPLLLLKHWQARCGRSCVFGFFCFFFATTRFSWTAGLSGTVLAPMSKNGAATSDSPPRNRRFPLASRLVDSCFSPSTSARGLFGPPSPNRAIPDPREVAAHPFFPSCVP